MLKMREAQVGRCRSQEMLRMREAQAGSCRGWDMQELGDTQAEGRTDREMQELGDVRDEGKQKLGITGVTPQSWGTMPVLGHRDAQVGMGQCSRSGAHSGQGDGNLGLAGHSGWAQLEHSWGRGMLLPPPECCQPPLAAATA